MPTYGSYAFVCGPSNIVMHFFGVEFKAEGAPIPLSYLAVINNDGSVHVPNNGYSPSEYKYIAPRVVKNQDNKKTATP